MKGLPGRTRSGRRAEAKAGTRRRIPDTATQVFAREGYHAARMDAIADTAGASKGALYSRFPGKLELFSALADEFAEGLAADVATAIREREGGVARGEAAVAAALGAFDRQRALTRIVLFGSGSLGPAYSAKRQEVLHRFVLLIGHYLEEAVAEGAIADLERAAPTLPA